MNCVNTSTSTFKELAKRNNVSESKLELIVHQYWLEDEGNTEFPSDVYIQAQLGNTKYREPSKAVREVWKTKYSKPQKFSSLKEVQQAVTEAQKFFPPSVIVYYKNNNGTFTLSVRQPVASLKHSINDFFKEGTSLDAGHFRTPLKGNQREQLFNIHDGIKRQLMFMEENQVKETLKTQIQNSDIPKETVEKISSAIDKMTKKQILSEIELMDREQEDFNIVLQDLREAGESIRFQQEKQETASAAEDEIQFSMDSPKHTFTFADGTKVETPFKLNDQQADALNAMNAFLHSNEAVMTLSGYAGTGKTSLMEILADKAKKDGISIKFTASTNKAAKVLKNRVFEKGFFAQTLHKLFAYELAQDETTEYDAKKHVTTRLEENAKYRPGDVIVIDEASMINDDLYRDIVEDAKNNHLKIIFVGDKKQLAPVGQKTISSVFKNNQSKVVELTKVERTGDNAILAEATRLRTDIPLTGISSFNSKGQGVAYMPKQKREELEKIIRYFAPNIKANPDYFRILAWSNNVVSEYNNMVRSILGYSSYVPQVGEPMMGYTNWGYKRNASPMEDPYDLVNSESYKVVAVGNPQTIKKSFVRVADGKDVTVEVESIPITLENSVGEVKNFDYIDVKQNAKNRNSAIILAQQKADLWNKYRTAPRGRADTYGTKGWYAARAGEIERFLFVNDDITKSNPRDPNKPITLQAKVIDFGYAMTVHKSQGSTFTHVLVDDVNISKASGFEDNAPSLSSAAEVSSEDLKTANETIEPVGPKKKLNIPGLANLLSKKSSQPETLISQATAPKPTNTNPDAADIVQQLKYVAVSRATDTVTIISDTVKKEDSPLNHINDQKPSSSSITEKVKAEVGKGAVKETIRTLESDNTELNTEEKKSIKEILGDTKPRILIASETTDPVWHAKKIKEMVEEELKKPAKERSFHMMYLITKHDGIPLKELMELKIPKFIHFSITSLGGTKYEPGVMKMDDLLDRIETFIKDGVLNPNLTTIRIDPIIPGVTTKKDIRHIIERASKMGIRQFKFSIMDSYGYTENGNRDRFIIQKMEELGYDWNTYYGKTSTGEVEFHPKQEYVESIFKYMNSLAEEFNIWFNTCGENSHGVKGLSRIKFDMGCVNVDSMNAAMGTNDIAHVRGKQRKDCSCYGLKSDALRYTDKCASSCVYCYASHNSDRYVQYYNEDGTLKDNKFTRTSEKAIDAQQTIDNKQTIALSETWQKAQAIQEPSGRRPVEYTSPGQPTRTYYVEGEHIYNDKDKEVYNAPQMRTHKNKILFKLAYKEGRAVIVNLKGNRYIVDRYQNILSVKTGEVMMWGDENGDKRDILALAENAFKDKLNTSQTTPQQSQQTSTQQTTPNYYEGRITPDANTIFVFGSNPEGRHGAGAALTARKQFGAIYGQGEGLQGNSYALPTKELRSKPLYSEDGGKTPITMYRGYALTENREAYNIEETIGKTAVDYDESLKGALYFTSSKEEAQDYARGRTDKSPEPPTQENPQGRSVNRHYTGDYAKVSRYFIASNAKVEHYKDINDYRKNGKNSTADVIILDKGTMWADNTEYIVRNPKVIVYDRMLRSISPEQITENIKKMYEVARQNPNKQFKVAYTNGLNEATLNGYTGAEMIKMFKDAGPIPSNVVFSKNWIDHWNEVPSVMRQPAQQQPTQQPTYSEEFYTKQSAQDYVNDLVADGVDRDSIKVVYTPAQEEDDEYWTVIVTRPVQQLQTRSLGEKETVSQAMEKTVKTLDDWLEYSRAHIKVDKENHKYYIDGEAADYSVTEYAESIFGKPDIKGDYSHSSAIGNTADAVYRDYFDPTKDVYAINYPNTNAERKAKMIQDAQRLEAYLDKVHGVKDGVRQYKVITREFPIAARFDTPDGMKTIAGTMDMIVIDKNGDIWIYDFKAKNHSIDAKYYDKASKEWKPYSDRRDYTAQQNLYRAILDANSAFEGQVKGLNLVWMDTDYPKLSNAQYKTDKKTGEVTVVVADGKTLNIPLAEYDGFKTPSLKPNVEDSIIPLDITDDIESLHIPELHAMDFITRQVVDYIKSLGIPVHTREELIQYLKDHGYENIQQSHDGIQMMVNRKHRKNPSSNKPRDLTLFSTRSKKDVAKVQKDLQIVAEKYKNQKSSKGFLTDLSSALGISKQNASEYVKFTAKDGTEFTIRVSNHNANAETFAENKELEDNISIVVKSKQSKNKFRPDDNVRLVEYVYFKEDIKESDTNVLSQIAEGLTKTVEDGTFTDTTGLAKVNTSPKSNQEANETKDIPFYLLKTPKGEVEIYGFIDPETLDMYLDDATINPEHPIHEYTHLWDRALYGMDPDHKLWNQGVKLMKQLKLWKEIENSEQYGQKWKKKGISEEKIEFLIGSEVHSRLVGKEGEALLERIANEEGQKGLIGKLKEWILSAWQALKGLMSDWSDEEIQKLTLEDFVNMVVKDLADGVVPQMILKNQAEERSTAGQEGRSSNMETNGTQEKPEILSLPNFENLINNQQPIELTSSELWKVPLLEKLDDSISDSNTDEKNQEIVDEITTLIQSVTEDEYKQNTKKIKKTQEKINEYKRINDQINALKGNTLGLESYEIRHVAEQVVDSISDTITELQNGKSTIEELFPDFKTDFNPKGASRAEIVTKIGIDNFISLTQERMKKAVKGNAKTPRDVMQFALLTRNWEALMTFAYDQFVANEGFGVRKSHTKKGFDVDANAKIDLTNAEDDRNDTDGVREVEGDAQEHWQVVFRTIDILNSMSEKVRMALHECYKIDKDGKQVASKWGIPERVDKREAVQSIIRWTQGALTLNQMIEKLAAQQEKNPWLNQLLVKLRDKNQSDFQSQFFGVMNKHFQLYSIVRLKNGKYVSMFINEHPAQTELMQSVKAMHKMGNHPLFTSSGVNTENLGYLHSYLDELNIIAKDLRDKTNVLRRRDTKAIAQLTEEQRQKAFQCLSAASKVLGFMIPDEAWGYAITAHNLMTYGTNKGIVSYLHHIVESLDKVVSSKQKDYDPFKFKGENNISGTLGNFLNFFTDHMDNTTSSSFYDDGNMYQSYVIPSFMTKLMSKFHGTPEEVKKFLDEEYGKSEWFFDKKNNRWRIKWLQRAAQASRDGMLAHKVELNFNKHSYMRTMTDAEYAVSLLSEYVAEASKGKTGEFLAWFRVPMLSNKPSSEFIRFYAFTGMNYQNDILDGMLDIFEQELSRIQTVRMRNKKKGDPGFIKNWDTNGRKFCFLPFLNEHLAENSSGELANLLKKKLEGKKELSAEQEKRLSDLVKEQIKNHIDERVKSIMEEWDAMGIMKAAEKVDNLGDNEEAIRNKVKEFLWNDTFASKMILQLTIGDIAFYKDAEDLQKRLAQIHAPGIRANVDAIDYAGNPVSADGKYRTFIIKDFDDFKSNVIANISEVFDRKIARARNDQERKSLEALKDSLVRPRTYKEDGSVDDEGGAYWKINVADAQGYSSPTSYRKKAFMFGKWSREAEDIYQRLLNDDYDYTSLKVAFQPLKPFVYSRIEKSTDVAGAPITKIYSPFQAKNAEYLLIMADAIMRGEENKTGALSRPNLLKAIYDIMEDSAYDGRERDEEGKIINQGTYNGKGIDTVQFESAIKSTLQSPINLHQFANKENGEREAYKHIRGIIYKNGKNTNKVDASDYDNVNSVHEVAFEDYCLQQEVPEHFKDHEQAHGSQIRMIIPSDLDYYYDPNRKDKDAKDNIVYYDVKQPDGKIKRYTASEFRAEYEKIISQNIEESLKDLAEELHINSSDKKERNIILSEFLQREIVDSPRYGIDLFQACSVDENGEFRIPLGDPIQAKRIEQLINSLIKNRVNKQKLPGGPVVQVSNFGTSKTLHIRFKDKAGNIIPLEDEYNPSEHDGKSYKQYLKENQAGIAYAEVYAPVYSDELIEKFGRPDGTIDVAAIEKLDPDLLTMVSYRIPTEDKYSCLPMKIVGFLPREAGEAIMLPYELTTIDGSDFDVDKRYIMHKDLKIVEDRNKKFKNLLQRVSKSYASKHDGKAPVGSVKKKIIDGINMFLDNPEEMQHASKFDEWLYNELKDIREKKEDIWKVVHDTTGRRARNNQIIDMTLAVLTHERTADKILNPGGFEEQKEMGYMVSAYKNPNNKKSWKELEGVAKSKDGISALKKLSYVEKDLTWADTQVHFYHQNNAGSSLIGVFAVNKVAHATLGDDNIKANIDYICGRAFNIAGFKFENDATGGMVIDPMYDAEGNLIGKTLGSLVGASADTAKDPVLDLMNINMETAGMLTTMLRMGMPFRDAALFLSQDIITKALAEHSKRKLEKYVSIESVVQEWVSKYESNNKITDDSHIHEEELTREELIKGLKGEESLSSRYKVMKNFLRIKALANAMRNPTFATRFNSITSAVGPLVVDNLILEHKMENYAMNPDFKEGEDQHQFIYEERDKDGKKTGKWIGCYLKDVFGLHPILNSFSKTVGMAHQMFEKDMPACSNSFKEVLNTIAKLHGSGFAEKFFKNKKLLDQLSLFYQSAMLVQGGLIDSSRLNYYIEDFPKDFMDNKYKEKYADNALINAIRPIPSSNTDRTFLTISLTGLTSQEKERLSSAWDDLHKKDPKLSQDLFNYCFFRAGIGFSPKTFISLVDTYVKENLSGTDADGNKVSYVDIFRQMPSMNPEVLIDLFMRNNWDNKRIVPAIDTKDMSFIYSSDGIEVHNNADKEKLTDTPYFTTEDKSGKTHLWKYEGERFDRLVYREVKLLGDNNEYVVILKDSKQLPTIESTGISEDTVNPDVDNSNIDGSEAEIQYYMESNPTEESEMSDDIKIRQNESSVARGIAETSREMVMDIPGLDPSKVQRSEDTSNLNLSRFSKRLDAVLQEQGVTYDEKEVKEELDKYC